MDHIAELSRCLTGQALVDATAEHLRRNLPRDPGHYQRRALAMLRQRGIDPFRRVARGTVCDAAAREMTVSHGRANIT